MTEVDVTIIVPAAYVQTVKSLCEKIAGQAGSGMFQRQAKKKGTETITHHISSGFINAEMLELMGDPAAIVTASEGAITLSQITAILSACDISEDDPFVALDRLGLELVTECLSYPV